MTFLFVSFFVLNLGSAALNLYCWLSTERGATTNLVLGVFNVVVIAYYMYIEYRESS